MFCESPVSVKEKTLRKKKTLLEIFKSSDAGISSTIAFPLLGNSDHVVVVPVSINSQQTQNRMPHFI